MFHCRFTRPLSQAFPPRKFFSRKLPELAGVSLRPTDVDIDITDIDLRSLSAVSEYFGIDRLAPVTTAPVIPIKGKIFGANDRVFFPLIVSRGDTAIATPFLYTASSPYTFLRRDTLNALGVTEDIPLGTEITIHGQKHFTVYESPRHFSSVDLLGQDFLKFSNLEVRLSPSMLKAVIVPASTKAMKAINFFSFSPDIETITTFAHLN
jgi:hypothetical protein